MGVLALLVIAGGAHAIWWRWAERQLAAELVGQINAARNAGWTVNAAPAAPGGWPFAATLSVPELIVSGSGNALAWSTDRLVLRVGLFSPLTLAIDSEGSQHLRLGSLPDIPFRADQLHAAVPLQVGMPARGFALRIVNLRAGLPFGEMSDAGGTEPAAVTVGGVNLRASWTPGAQQNEAAVSVSLSLTSVQLPADHPWPLGAAIASASADLAVNGPLPRSKETASAWAAAWRDGGGNLEVAHLVLNWGALAVSGNATLALDAQMQPMGAGVLRASNPEGTLAALRESGMIGERAELAAKALLALMSHPPADDGRPGVDLPVTLQDRRLSISRFGVARLPPVAWQW